MGNQGGVIHNQSDTEIVYILHYTQILKEQLQIILNGEKAEIKGHYLDVDYRIGQLQRRLRQKLNCVYYLKALSITTVGLNCIDFQKIKFISIVWKWQGQHKSLIYSRKVSSVEDIRIKIRSDGSCLLMSQKEAQQLIRVSNGCQIDSGYCEICNSHTDYIQFMSGTTMHCKECNEKVNQLWICQRYPLKHCFCGDCNELLRKRKLNVFRNTKEQNSSIKIVKITNTQVEAKIISKTEIKTELNTGILQKKNKNAQEKIQKQKKKEQMPSRQEKKAGFQKRKLERIKSLTEGTTLKSNECPKPKCSKAKADFIVYQGERQCKLCENNFNKLWVCCSDPIGHHCCQVCYEDLIKQAEYEKKKVQS